MDAEIILQFMLALSLSLSLSPSLTPSLTHSAGVGRTGSLICIDVELQRAKQESVVDPFNFTLQMRHQRNHMVQTEVIDPLC